MSAFSDFAKGLEKTSSAIKRASKVNSTENSLSGKRASGQLNLKTGKKVVVPGKNDWIERTIQGLQLKTGKKVVVPGKGNIAGPPSPPAANREVLRLQEIARLPKTSKKYREEFGGEKGHVEDKLHNLINRTLGASAKQREAYGDAASISGIGQADFAKKGLNTAVNVGAATVKDPVDVIGNTAKAVPETLASIPASLVNIVKLTAKDGPVDAAKQIGEAIGDDYEKRYSQSNKGQKDRFKKQGILPELLDATVVVGGVGAGAGRVVTQLAEKGKLGKSLQKTVVEPRPKLRTSGGKTVDQKLSPNFYKAVAQKKLDKQRAKKQAKVEELREVKKISGERHSVGAGEVAPLFDRTFKRTQTHDVAELKSRRTQKLKRMTHKVVHAGQNRDLAWLNRDERRGFKYAVQHGIRTPEAAKKVLPARVSQIERARTMKQVKPGPFRKKNNDLAVITRIMQDPEKVFTPRLAKVADKSRRREKQTAALNPSFSQTDALKRRYTQQADLLGMGKIEDVLKTNVAVEKSIDRAQRKGRINKRQATASRAQVAEKMPPTLEGVISQIRQRAKEKGLDDPAYFPSERFEKENNADYALGGTKAVKERGKYEGKTYELGMEDTRPQVFSDALARNIKLLHNWNAVADNLERHTIKGGANLSVTDALNFLEQNGIDQSTVRLWNPRKMRGQKVGGEADSGAEETSGQLLANLEENTYTPQQAAAKAETKDFKNSRFHIIPKAVYDEIHMDTKPSGKAGRSVDIAKQKASKLILGTSPKWAIAQPVANAVTAGLAGTGPVSFVKAQRFWKKLSEKERQALEPYLGVGPFQQDVQYTKLGSAADGRLLNAYRGFKQTAFYKYYGTKAGQKIGNPLDLLFRFDNAQNNAFRKAVLYKKAKQEAYGRMGANARGIMDAQKKLFAKDDLTKAVLNDPATVEKLAKHVNDFLGDYVTYTAKERKYFQRYIMFYGFLRFSLRLTFRTMPAQHPILSSILAQLGRLQADETREIMGLEPGERLPAYVAGRVFDKDGTEAVDIGRINPALNALISAQGSAQLAGATNPVAKTVFEQIAKMNSFTEQPFKVDGKSYKAKGDPGPDLEDRGRIVLGQMLSMASPYRTANDIANPGPQGDDSLLWSPKPTKYKSPDVVASIEKSKREQQEEPIPARVLKSIVPFLPEKDYSKQSLAKKKVKKKKNSLDDLYKEVYSTPASSSESELDALYKEVYG